MGAGEDRRLRATKIYLDVCALKRPYDSISVQRNADEAVAVVKVLAAIDSGVLAGLHSSIHDIENARNTDLSRRARIESVLRRFERVETEEASVQSRAVTLQSLGFGKVDAVHLACAEAGNAHAFLTTDDRLLRCAERHQPELAATVISPVDFVRRWLL